MKGLLRFLVVSIFVGTFNLLGAIYFVGPDASETGNGTADRPWLLQVALTNSGKILPGDVVLLRGGTYAALFKAQLYGSAEAPIKFRNFGRERAVLDGQLDLTDSKHLWLWGLEFVDSQKANRPNPFDTIRMGSLGTKIINCIIHDSCIGIAPPGVYEAYGNVMWNCGKSGLEHAIYWQNDGAAPKLIENNLIGYSSGFGIHCYSSQGQLKRLQIIGNAVWGSGIPIDPKAEILVGGGQPVVDCVISNNHCYSIGRGVNLGYGAENTNAIVTGNYLFGSPGFLLQSPIHYLAFSGNIVGTAVSLDVASPMAKIGLGPHSWDRNQFYSRKWNWSSAFAAMGGTNISFAQWKQTTGFDAASSYVNGDPPDRVVIQPNRYESKRAHIIVWNWKAAHNVTADISKVLSMGDRYEVRSALNYFGGPVKVGVYNGQPLQLPMTNLTVAPVLYWNAPKPLSNFSTNFAAFVLIGANTNSLAAAEELKVLPAN